MNTTIQKTYHNFLHQFKSKKKNKILFLDESGDHNLAKIDPKHPIFVLGGVIVDRDYAFGEMTSKVKEFKKEIFNTTKITLHTADFTRQKNGFEQIKERKFCENFYSKLNQLISDLDIQIIACAIKKEKHMIRYGLEAIDPYHLSLNVLVERFCFELDNLHKGQIIAEARDVHLNRQLDLAWQSLRISGTKFTSPTKINQNINDLALRRKEDNLAGLEIADAIVTPIARSIIGRESRIDINLIKQKMRKNNLGEIDGRGLIILPKN